MQLSSVARVSNYRLLTCELKPATEMQETNEEQYQAVNPSQEPVGILEEVRISS